MSLVILTDDMTRKILTRGHECSARMRLDVESSLRTMYISIREENNSAQRLGGEGV